MNFTTITMPRHAARSAFIAYRNAVADRHNDEDEAVMRGYKALAEGSALLDLSASLRAAGQDSLGRPKIAIVRADFKWGHFRYVGDAGAAQFIGTHLDERRIDWGIKVYKSNSVQVPSGVLNAPATWGDRARAEGRALVPSIPPQFRPKAKLSNYHILWEAEWQPLPPTDPLLLKHVGGTLYVVLAQWDLTPVERAVLAGRLAT